MQIENLFTERKSQTNIKTGIMHIYTYRQIDRYRYKYNGKSEYKIFPFLYIHYISSRDINDLNGQCDKKFGILTVFFSTSA